MLPNPWMKPERLTERPQETLILSQWTPSAWHLPELLGGTIEGIRSSCFKISPNKRFYTILFIIVVYRR